MRCVITHDHPIHSVVEHFLIVANQAQNVIRFDKIQMGPSDLRLFPLRARLSGPSACRRALTVKSRHRVADEDFLICVVRSKIYDFEDDEYFSVTPIDYPSNLPEQPRVGIVSRYYERENSDFKRPRNRRLLRDRKRLWDSFSAREREFVDENVLLLCLLNVVSVLIGAQTEHRDERVSRGCINDYDQEAYEVLRAIRHGFYFCREECRPALQLTRVGRAILAIADRLTAVPRDPDLRELFISYASEDQTTVAPLVKALKELGLRVWFDKYDMIPGRSVVSQLTAAMRDTRNAVLFLTPAYLAKLDAGGWVELEESTLVGQHKASGRLIPVWHDVGESEVSAVSGLLSGISALRTQGDASRLAGRLLELVRGPHARGPFRHPGVRRRRRNRV